jgi:hypothetical protein
VNLSRLVYLITGAQKPRKQRTRRKFRPNENRSRDYKAWIRTLDCVVPWCSFHPVHAAHTGTDGGTAIKASDWSCAPICAIHHVVYHRIGRKAFEVRYRLNFASLVEKLNGIFRELRGAA